MTVPGALGPGAVHDAVPGPGLGTEASGRPRVGMSSCLLGEEVRFNGGHKRSPFLTDELGRYVDWVAYCPEMEFGLGTPREPLRLTADAALVNRSGTVDHIYSKLAHEALASSVSPFLVFITPALAGLLLKMGEDIVSIAQIDAEPTAHTLELRFTVIGVYGK